MRSNILSNNNYQALSQKFRQIISLFVSPKMAQVEAENTWGKNQCLPGFIPSRSQVTHMKTWLIKHKIGRH